MTRRCRCAFLSVLLAAAPVLGTTPDLGLALTSARGEAVVCQHPRLDGWPRVADRDFGVSVDPDGTVRIENGCRDGVTFVLRCDGLVSEPVRPDPPKCEGTAPLPLHRAVPVLFHLRPEGGEPSPRVVKLAMVPVSGTPPGDPSPLVYWADVGQGGVVTTELPAGRWDITVLSETFAPATLWDVALDPARPFGPAEVTLHGGSSILVRARDDRDGRPLAGATVCVAPETALPEVAGALATARRPPAGWCAATNARGWVRLAGLSEGEFLLVASAPGHALACRRVDLTAGAETLVDDLYLGETATVTVAAEGVGGLPAGSSLIVTATPRLCGKPLDVLERSARVPAGGDVVLDGLVPGRLEVQGTLVTGTGLAAAVARETVEIAGGEARFVSLHLAGRLFRGSVTLHGEPLAADLEFRAADGESPSVGAARADTAGEFAVLLPRPGRYDVRVLSTDPPLDTVVPRVRFADPRTPVQVRLPDTAVRGVVVDENGRGVGDARITALWKRGPDDGAEDRGARPVRASTRSRDDGSFALEGLVPGQWWIQALRGEASSEQRVVALSDDASVEGVVLTLRDSLRIEGTVRSAGGSPVPGARVIVVPAGATLSARVATTDTGGRFRLLVPVGAGHPANVEVVGPGAPAWCARLRLAAHLDLVVTEAGGDALVDVPADSDPPDFRRLALVRRDGSFFGVVELLASGHAASENRDLLLRALIPGTYKLVDPAAPGALPAIVGGSGWGLPALATIAITPGSSATVTIRVPGG